jgi:Cys-tRNA(Pro)/Cys-tRNA(Cys) deacylase
VAGTPATVALAALGIRFTAHEYSHVPSAASYGLEAAEALGVEPERVFKTLLAVGAKKAVMADAAVAERKTGYVVGGISPIGQKTRLTTVLDETAELFDTVFVSGGRRGFEVELSPADLVAATGAIVAAIGRN